MKEKIKQTTSNTRRSSTIVSLAMQVTMGGMYGTDLLVADDENAGPSSKIIHHDGGDDGKERKEGGNILI